MIAMCIHSSQLFFSNPCQFPIAYAYLGLIYTIIFVILCSQMPQLFKTLVVKENLANAKTWEGD